MIAVPYLNYIRTQLGDFTTSWEELNDVAKIYKLAVLYSQEFKPEMIVELFEGWEYSKGSYLSTGIPYCIIHNNNLIKLGIHNNNEMYIISDKINKSATLLPKTLDQFITDCMRAGIELQWKESIVEKYFK